MAQSDRPRFEFVPHTADIGVVAYGADLREAFANAAYALFSLLVEVDDVREVVSVPVEVSAPDQETLLVEWLNELLFLFDAEHLLFRRFVVHELEGDHLRATAWGEAVDLSRHHLKGAVKATTYHQLQVGCDHTGCWVRVVFDV